MNKLILTVAQENTPESQCGFRSNRGTVDMIFVLRLVSWCFEPSQPQMITSSRAIVLRQIQEKCREQNMGLYAAFVDLTKAFDTLSRDGL